MKLETDYNKRKELYDRYLNTINNVRFTFREIDILSCIIHNRGEKKISSLILISPRTVSTHIRNIMLKLGCNSREHLIDFIENSGCLLLIREYYLHLLIHFAFENHLIKLNKIILSRQEITCVNALSNMSNEEKITLSQIREHLKLVNIKLVQSSEDKSNNKKLVYILTDELPQAVDQEGNIFLLLDQGYTLINNNDLDYIDFSKKQDYYFAIFKLLQKIIVYPVVEKTLKEFTLQYEAITNSWNGEGTSLKAEAHSIIREKLKKKYSTYIILSVVTLVALAVWIFSKVIILSSRPSSEMISSNLPLPHESVLLTRSKILSEIDEKFADIKGIQIIALVGVGGSGKTTIARQYARAQKVPLIWEINAETKYSLISSLEILAYSLCKTEEDKQEVIAIQSTKNDSERRKKLSFFLSRMAKAYPSWLIIYNNVESFKDIQKYLPHNPQLWGNGKIIITTCDSNIAHSSYIFSSNIIHVKELDKEEKLLLFNKIINSNGNNIKGDQLENLDFLEKITPFPLDISLAAYYIKEEKVSPAQYLEYLSELREEFISTQEIILNEIGEYPKTRNEIITLSAKQIISAHHDFKDLLLFISLISAENIPKDLLIKYKGEIIANKFIHELKKFSFVDFKPADMSQQSSTFSIHRSIQAAILTYLIKTLKLNEDQELLSNINGILEDYISNALDKKVDTELLLSISHAEAFLKHEYLLNKPNKSSIAQQLACCYFNIAAYDKSKDLYEQIFKVYKEDFGDDHPKTAEVLASLGIVYRNMGAYIKANELLEQAFKFYKKHYGENCIETARVAVGLGSVYRNIGKYKEAEQLLNNAYNFYKREYGLDNVNTAWAAGYLGNVYKNLGNYTKAKEFTEYVMKTYEEHYGANHSKIAWALVRLGSIYRKLGDYQQAKKFFEQALETYKKCYGENCIETAWTLVHLGNVFRDLGDNKKAQKLLQQSLTIYNNYFDNSSIIIAWNLLNLGNVYQNLGDYEKAQDLIKRSLEVYCSFYGEDHVKTIEVFKDLGSTYLAQGKIDEAENYLHLAINKFSNQNNMGYYIYLESLADLYIVKSEKAVDKHDRLGYKNKAVNYLKEALNSVNRYYPNNSIHTNRLQSKLTNIQDV